MEIEKMSDENIKGLAEQAGFFSTSDVWWRQTIIALKKFTKLINRGSIDAMCPFCWEEDAFGMHYEAKLDTTADPEWRVKCHGCFALGPPGNTGNQAIEAWNRREI